MIIAHSGAAPKKIKIYLHLILTAYKGNHYQDNFSSSSYIVTHTFLLKEGSASPKQAEIFGRIPVVPANSIATATLICSAQQ